MADQTTEPQSTQNAAEAAPGVHVIDSKHEPYRLYRVIADDDSVVERTAREVAEGSKMLSNLDLWHQNFRATLARVRAWCGARSKSLRAALVDIRSNKVLIYFIPESSRYDLELGAAMTELEVEIGGSAGIGYFESLQVPARSLERFIGPRSLIIWARPGDTLFAQTDSQQD
jgi:hypothetical protein